MSQFAKGVASYTVQVVVALVVGTVVGSVVGIGLHRLFTGEVSRDEMIAIVNGSISATATAIVILTVIGSFPVGRKDP